MDTVTGVGQVVTGGETAGAVTTRVGCAGVHLRVAVAAGVRHVTHAYVIVLPITALAVNTGIAETVVNVHFTVFTWGTNINANTCTLDDLTLKFLQCSRGVHALVIELLTAGLQGLL